MAYNEGYGGMMSFNLRTRSDNDPLPELQALSDGAYFEAPVICPIGAGNRERPEPVPGGYTITYDMAIENE